MSVLTDEDIEKFDSTQTAVKKPNPKVLTDADIATFDKNTVMTANRANPAMQGGANAPALVQARQGLQQATKQSNAVDTPVAIGRAAYNLTWPASAIAKKLLDKEKLPFQNPLRVAVKPLQMSLWWLILY